MTEPMLSTEAAMPQNNAPRTLTIRIPRLNLQAILLGVIALITLLQTAQIYGLKLKVGSANVRPASATTTSGINNATTAPAGNSSALPEMVGGC